MRPCARVRWYGRPRRAARDQLVRSAETCIEIPLAPGTTNATRQAVVGAARATRAAAIDRAACRERQVMHDGTRTLQIDRAGAPGDRERCWRETGDRISCSCSSSVIPCHRLWFFSDSIENEHSALAATAYKAPNNEETSIGLGAASFLNTFLYGKAAHIMEHHSKRVTFRLLYSRLILYHNNILAGSYL
ncbi:hypothetical protein SEVIR_2G215750v4 [Setaria viridis]